MRNILIIVFMSLFLHATADIRPHRHIFHEGRAATYINGKWGLIDKSGKLIAQPIYDDIGFFSEGYAPVKLNNKWGFINKAGGLDVKHIYDDVKIFHEGFAPVKLNNKWGFIDIKGKILDALIYEDVRPFFCRLAAVKINNKWGFIDRTGMIVIQPMFSNVMGGFKEDLCPVEDNEKKWGFIDKAGNFKIKPRFDCAFPFENGHAIINCGNINGVAVTEDERISRIMNDTETGLINKEGEYVIKPTSLFHFDSRSVSNMLFPFRNGEDKWGFVDKDGKVVIKPVYDDTMDYRGGLAAVKSKEKWGYIDEKGNTVIFPQYDSVESFKEGIAVVTIGNMYGCIDSKGEYIIPLQYDFIFNDFSDGLSPAILKEKHGYVDLKNNFISNENIGFYKEKEPMREEDKVFKGFFLVEKLPGKSDIDSIKDGDSVVKVMKVFGMPTEIGCDRMILPDTDEKKVILYGLGWNLYTENAGKKDFLKVWIQLKRQHEGEDKDYGNPILWERGKKTEGWIVDSITVDKNPPK